MSLASLERAYLLELQQSLVGIQSSGSIDTEAKEGAFVLGVSFAVREALDALKVLPQTRENAIAADVVSGALKVVLAATKDVMLP